MNWTAEKRELFAFFCFVPSTVWNPCWDLHLNCAPEASRRNSKPAIHGCNYGMAKGNQGGCSFSIPGINMAVLCLVSLVEQRTLVLKLRSYYNIATTQCQLQLQPHLCHPNFNQHISDMADAEFESSSEAQWEDINRQNIY
ncbi:hypothetical protein CEXT_181561 [Caerostris extrusa]|uniref:Uncharacterized protein n=1 Tax=Caerostris extrusa TaxID=172846 RepID=A0AAV4PYM2_CAEEX|nr:hypothetical protein CEXT_181561 [Caerostris extrusa]